VAAEDTDTTMAAVAVVLEDLKLVRDNLLVQLEVHTLFLLVVEEILIQMQELILQYLDLLLFQQ
jgi:hypothetical protein